MTPALPVCRVAAVAAAAAVIAALTGGAPHAGAGPAAPERPAGGGVIRALYESPLQKWKRQCRRAGGRYEKYCAGGVRHCCCYSARYCEGMPEPVDALRQPGAGGGTGPPGGTSAPPGGQPLTPRPRMQ